MIRVFVIEDHPWIITGLKYEFRPSRDKIEIKGSSSRISEVIDNLKSDDFDLFLGVSDPINNVQKLQGKFPDKPIMIFTHEESPFWKQTMFNAGVKAYLIKEIGKKELKNAILKVIKGEIVFPDLAFLKENSKGKLAKTTQKVILKPSEKEAFLLLSRGISQKTIADIQHKSQSSIEKSMRKIRKHFHVKSNSEVIRILTQLKEI